MKNATIAALTVLVIYGVDPYAVLLYAVSNQGLKKILLKLIIEQIERDCQAWRMQITE